MNLYEVTFLKTKKEKFEYRIEGSEIVEVDEFNDHTTVAGYVGQKAEAQGFLIQIELKPTKAYVKCFSSLDPKVCFGTYVIREF